MLDIVGYSRTVVAVVGIDGAHPGTAGVDHHCNNSMVFKEKVSTLMYSIPGNNNMALETLSLRDHLRSGRRTVCHGHRVLAAWEVDSSFFHARPLRSPQDPCRDAQLHQPPPVSYRYKISRANIQCVTMHGKDQAILNIINERGGSKRVVFLQNIDVKRFVRFSSSVDLQISRAMSFKLNTRPSLVLYMLDILSLQGLSERISNSD